jgi:excisionase family DNA binding protein
MALANKRPNDVLTPQQVAELLMVSPVTVRQWAQKGELKALITPGGHRRFRLRDVECFGRQRGIALQLRDKVRRILVVDDDPQLSGYLVELLGSLSEPIATEVAKDGFDAGQKVLTFRPDIVLLDLMMPGLDGFEVSRRLKRDPATSDVRIIAMTGYPSPGNIERIRAAGAEACLAKPISIQALLDAIGIHQSVALSFSEQ